MTDFITFESVNGAVVRVAMNILEHTEIGGERPLFGSKSVMLTDVTIRMGESALKLSADVVARNCRIEGMYVFWECKDVKCADTYFSDSARACSWYGTNHSYNRCKVDSPKMFRELKGLQVTDTVMNNAAETFWKCTDADLLQVELHGAEYCFLNAADVHINEMHEDGKYAFQYARRIEIHNSVLDTKDAFWESEDCTIYDSQIRGEYLGWYSRNLRLVRCRISGTQPLCYCKNLVLEDCVFAADADRCFENSSVSGSVIGSVASVVEPVFGHITYK